MISKSIGKMLDSSWLKYGFFKKEKEEKIIKTCPTCKSDKVTNMVLDSKIANCCSTCGFVWKKLKTN
jgi:hypothetical protein